ncbi:hypothetical protein SNK03_002413 [Fusarium graminearum]
MTEANRRLSLPLSEAILMTRDLTNAHSHTNHTICIHPLRRLRCITPTIIIDRVPHLLCTLHHRRLHTAFGFSSFDAAESSPKAMSRDSWMLDSMLFLVKHDLIGRHKK